MNQITPSTYSNIPPKIIETPSKDTITNATTVRKWKLNPFYSTIKATNTPIIPPPPNQYYNCMSRNIVYLITCKYKNCGAQYVGYSMRQLRERFIEHEMTYESPVGRHVLLGT